MLKYQFSTVKLISSLVRDEPINIGVILYDSEKNIAYPKFTKNWKEVSRRTNISTLPGLTKILDLKFINTNKDYLNILSSNKTQDSLFVTKPRPISIIGTPAKTIEVLFSTQISLPPKDTMNRIKVNMSHNWLKNIITKKNFPNETYGEKYKFDAILNKKFPYVFLKNGFPYFGIDYLSLHPTNVIVTVKTKSFDINFIRNSQQPKQQTKFHLFSTQEKDEIDLNNKYVQHGIELLRKSDIPLIYKSKQELVVDQLREILTV